jgi:hypothetical protein
MAKKPPNHDENLIITILTNLATGSISAEDAAAQANMTLDELLDFIDTHPQVKLEADRRAAEHRTDPATISRASLEGLSAVAHELSRRAKLDGSNLSVNELTGLGTLLDKVSAASKSAEIQAKATEQVERRECTATMLFDHRPPPGAIEGRGFRIWHLKANHPAMLNSLPFDSNDTKAQREAKVLKWWNRWFPLGKDGQAHDLGEMLQPGDRLFDGEKWWTT